jgi:nucleotide-binding universal stress UspA family protein
MTTEGNGQPLVIVGVDGSAESVTALKWASAYASVTGATLRAAIAWHYPAVGPGPVGLAPESVSDEVRQSMRRVLANAVAAAKADAEQVVAYGHPAQVLVDASKAAELLVVGSRGHGAFTGMMVGSVSIHCVTHAHCPVVVVRGDE